MREPIELEEPAVGSRPASWNRPTVSTRLIDDDVDGHWINLLFGIVNILILLALLTLGIALLIMSFAPSDATRFLTKHQGPLSLASRGVFLAGAVCCLATIKIYGRRLEDVWRWARLETTGELTVDELGITVTHKAVLASGVFLSWENIRAIAFDTGSSHDTTTHWRRFPILPRTKPTRYLFATDGSAVESSALITSRPTPPNMVIVLTNPVQLHNPHIQETDVAFPTEATEGMPSRPPREQTAAHIMFLRAANASEVRRILGTTGKVRLIQQTDLPALSLDRSTSIGN